MISNLLSFLDYATSILFYFSEYQMRKSTRIVFTLPLYLKEKLERIANDYGCSQSEILRLALVKKLEEKV